MTFDGATGLPPGTPRTINLSNLRDVRLKMAYIYRRMEYGIIQAADGTKLVYVLRQIGDIITLAEFERRIQELEDRYKAQRLEAGKRASGLPVAAYQH